MLPALSLPQFLASVVARKIFVAYVHQIKLDPLKYLPQQGK